VVDGFLSELVERERVRHDRGVETARGVRRKNQFHVAAERMELVDFDLTLIATPSLPDAQGDGFNDCTYAATCPAP